jgi:ribose transport system substrate-binding protein
VFGKRCKIGLTTLAAGVCVLPVLGLDAASASTSRAAATKPPAFAPLLPTKPGSGKGLTIGYISLDESIPYIHTVTKGLQANAKIAGAKLIVCDSKTDAAAALTCAQTFKTQNVDGILNFQVHADASAKICAAGPAVPTIAIDIEQKPCMKSFLGVSNFGAGYITGTGGGKAYKARFGCTYDALFLVSQPSAGSVIAQRRAGMVQGWQSVCGKIHNLKELGGDGTAQQAQTLVTDALTAVPSPQKVVVLSLIGNMTLGALAAAKGANRQDDVKVVGFGGDQSQFCNEMKNPIWLGDTLLFPEHYGPVAIQNIIKAIKGQPIAKTLYIKSAFADNTSIPKYYPKLKSCVP